MSTLVAMSLPGLVVVLVVVGVIDVALARRRRARGDRRATARSAAAGLDVLGVALSPGHQHKLEHDEFVEFDRDEEGDGAPPRSVVDLDAGVARLVIPRPGTTTER
jgi:hypothetical protein